MRRRFRALLLNGSAFLDWHGADPFGGLGRFEDAFEAPQLTSAFHPLRTFTVSGSKAGQKIRLLSSELLICEDPFLVKFRKLADLIDHHIGQCGHALGAIAEITELVVHKASFASSA
jgi:hypothetical protein